MATTEETVAARTGGQFLDGLRGDAREIWLNGEKITHPLEHPQLAEAARTMARVEGPPEPMMSPVLSLETSFSSRPASRIACSMAM
jgi:hypothetical protein